jgi:ectoine hydroxylase-related dioxygenase (phytanoyl-CoA dioxygenase family)
VEGDNGEGVRGSRAFLDLARDPEIVELVSGVLGEDLILWGCHVFCKPAAEGYETPWHQDGHYWPIRPLANCTVWVALEESSRERTGACASSPARTPPESCTSTCTRTAAT